MIFASLATRHAAAGIGVLVLWSTLAAPAFAADSKLPADLDLVPRDAAGFFHARAADVWKSEMLTDLRHLLKHAGVQNLATFEKRCPVPPDTIDRITCIMLTPKSLAEPFPDVDPEAVSCLVVVRTTKPYARLPLLKALGYREKVYQRQLYHFTEELWSGLYLIDDQTFLVGSEDALIQFLEHRSDSAKTGPLQAALELAAGKHHFVLGLNPASLAKENFANAIPQNLQPLMKARSITFTADFDKETQVAVRLDYEKEEQAKTGEKALRAALDMARGALSFPISELEAKLDKDPKEARPNVGDLPESFGLLVAIGFMKELDGMMDRAVITQKGTTVHLPAKFSRMYSGNSGMLVMLSGVSMMGRIAYSSFAEVGDVIGGGPNKDPNEEHLRKLVDAMERYREKHGTYPPAAIADKDGRPVLSWRVAILPYLGEDALYKEFRLDEPWDSLHNKKLIKSLPKCLTTVRYWRGPKGKTSDLVFAGENTIFEGMKGQKKDEVAPKTILLLQAGANQAVYWTKPADLNVKGDKVPELFERFGGQVRVILADGTYRTFNKGEEKTIQELISRKNKVQK
jgi:hypothetical protein